ncbi:hypothetical protein BDW74DRAFT_164268 [Aspergillus multicolor]|uniref:uncharacterized protein n=1 Tax=Aspergillus multicolor TaxID=41759 RepID=UPI003CCE3713
MEVKAPQLSRVVANLLPNLTRRCSVMSLKINSRLDHKSPGSRALKGSKASKGSRGRSTCGRSSSLVSRSLILMSLISTSLSPSSLNSLSLIAKTLVWVVIERSNASQSPGLASAGTSVRSEGAGVPCGGSSSTPVKVAAGEATLHPSGVSGLASNNPRVRNGSFLVQKTPGVT